jgi:superfamily II DNA or RNA helicase
MDENAVPAAVTADAQRLIEAAAVGSLGWKLPLLIALDETGEIHTSRVRQVVDAAERACRAAPEFAPTYRDALKEALGAWRCERPLHQRKLFAKDRSLISAKRSAVAEDLTKFLRAASADATIESWTAEWLSSDQATEEEDGGEEPVGSHTAFAEGSWQARTVEHLAAVLTGRQLEAALGKQFVKALRAWRRLVEKRDRPNTKVELLEALLIQHGADLLRACKPLRKALGTAARVDTPDAFHSGKAAAIQFVRELGLPTELAGIPSPPRPPAALLVPGPQSLRELEDYQREAKADIEDALRNGKAVVCSLPTGGGKTRVAIEALVEWACGELASGRTERPVMVWAAHTQELCAQAMEAFRAVWEVRAASRTLLLGNTAAVGTQLRDPLQELMQEPWDAMVVVTTPIVGAKAIGDGGWLRELDLPPVSALVIDEAHRAAAPTYGRLIEAVQDGGRESRVPVIGLTATPFRTVLGAHEADEATAALREIFCDGLITPAILGNDPKQVLIDRRCLARPTYTPLRGANLGPVASASSADTTEEALDQELGKLAGKSLPRRRRVFTLLHRLLEAEPDARILYFGPTVADAEVMAFLLLKSGFRAASLSAKTHASARRETVRQFKGGAYQVLCNQGVLTTGFDDPRITHVVIARPTVSLVLFEQMVGRGLRGPLFGGTEECQIHAVEDSFDGGAATQQVAQAFIDSWTPHIRVTARLGA